MSPTTATVKNMPNNGMGFVLSVGTHSSSSVSHVNEEQACANVSERKQAIAVPVH